MTDTRVEMGRVVAVHGVRGALKVESWAEPRNGIFNYPRWTLVLKDGVQHHVEGVKGHQHGKGLLAMLPGVDDRDQAQRWVGAKIFIDRADMPEPEAGEFYWADLEGLAVQTTEGFDLGTVDHLIATGANDVLVVIDKDKRKRLLPFVTGDCVKDVDLQSGRMLVDWDPEF